MRYFVDIRVGCGAVMDRQHPDYDESSPGLHFNTGGVVIYKHGFKSNPDTGGWEMREEDIEELQALCDKLNVWPDRDKKLNSLGI